MPKNIENLARQLGATFVGAVPETSAGAFGIAALANTLSQRLESSVGKDLSTHPGMWDARFQRRRSP
jgi:hypothetical protein